MIHVITIDEERNFLMSTFENADEQDTSGTELAEERFTQLVRELNEDETDEWIEAALEDGYYSYNGNDIYITHSFPENL